MASDQEDKQKPRKRRWGAAPSSLSSTGGAVSAGGSSPASAVTTIAQVPAAAVAPPPSADPRAKVLAMQESIRARLAAAKAKKQLPGVSVVASAVPPPTKRRFDDLVASSSSATNTATVTTATARDNQAKRAKLFEVDFSVTGPLSKPGGGATNKMQPPNKKVNPYLAHTMTTTTTTMATKSKSFGKTTAKETATTTTKAADETKVYEGNNINKYDNADNDNDDDMVDPRLQRTSKPRSRRRELKFVQPGHWQQVAERKRELALKAEISGFVSGRKTGHTLNAATMAQVYGGGGGGGATADADVGAIVEQDDTAEPRSDAVPDPGGMPLAMEWWDVALLPNKLKKEVMTMEAKLLSRQAKAAMQQLDAATDDQETTSPSLLDEVKECEGLRARCFREASLMHSKTATLVQHIVPVQPPRQAVEKQPILHLTKKELKRQRKLRRQARQRELQDMQAAGLIPAPEPRLTLKNFIQVLGDQAYLDPSKMEQKVQEQMEARQRTHLERNEANKLTKEQKAAKRVRKYHEDTSTGVTVAVFYVLDMSHPYHRTKVELNAQQNLITGGVLECEVPRLSCIICEGGPKAIKRYRRLMEVRMKWTGPDDSDGTGGGPVEDGDNNEEEGTIKFNPNNKCELVWQGMAVKRHFKGFVFQACENADQARKVLKSKGVVHYWDQVLEHHKSGRSTNALQLRLADDDSSSSDEEDEEIVMQETAEA